MAKGKHTKKHRRWLIEQIVRLRQEREELASTLAHVQANMDILYGDELKMALVAMDKSTGELGAAFEGASEAIKKHVISTVHDILAKIDKPKGLIYKTHVTHKMTGDGLTVEVHVEAEIEAPSLDFKLDPSMSPAEAVSQVWIAGMEYVLKEGVPVSYALHGLKMITDYDAEQQVVQVDLCKEGDEVPAVHVTMDKDYGKVFCVEAGGAKYVNIDEVCWWDGSELRVPEAMLGPEPTVTIRHGDEVGTPYSSGKVWWTDNFLHALQLASPGILSFETKLEAKALLKGTLVVDLPHGVTPALQEAINKAAVTLDKKVSPGAPNVKLKKNLPKAKSKHDGLLEADWPSAGPHVHVIPPYKK